MVVVHGRGLPHPVTRRELLALAPAVLATAAQDKKPNVILVISDDQGYGDISLHGNTILQTPNMDRVAREGIRYDQFHVNPVCSPTRASLLTGRHYYRTGVVDTYLGRSMMWPDEVTLPEVLRKAGYRTGHFGKWHLGDHYPLRPMEQGFDLSVSHHGGGIGQPSDIPGGDHYFDATLYRNGEKFKSKGYCTDVFFDEALDFIGKNKDKPFFAYIPTNAPHDPLEVDPKWVAPFQGKVDDFTAKVYGMCANLDMNLGRLIARLDELKLAENTILIFMTDNGPQRDRYNAGMRGRKGMVYEGGLRVPFFVRWPARIKAGHVDNRLAAHIDFFPTIAAACGVPMPKGVKIDGRDIMGKDTSDRTLCFQWHRGDRGRLYENCAAIGPRYKLVNGKELYDLKADAGEKNDIAAQNPNEVARLRREYEAWFRDVEGTRGFKLPSIWLGDPHENPVLLSRQDWRGPKAGWGAKDIGYWEVDVRRVGKYELEVILGTPAESGESVSVSLNSIATTIRPAAGAISIRIKLSDPVPRGIGRLEVIRRSADGKAEMGCHYVQVTRIG